MGKALIFGDIIISNPIANLTLNDALSDDVRAYVDKLSVHPSDTVKAAFQTFYETLETANVINNMKAFYPMYGSTADCAYGIVGSDLILPTGGLVYDKGLNLTEATGGAGVQAKGILVDSEKNIIEGVNDAFSFYFYTPYDLTSASKGYLSCLLKAYDDTTVYHRFGIKDKSLIGFNASYTDNSILTKGTKAETFTYASDKLYNNKNLVSTGKTLGNIPDANLLGINIIKTPAMLNFPFNCYMIFKETHTPEQVAIVSDAIEALNNVIFV